MKLGIMQPYFFPYLGYFDLILKTDLWIFFDVVAYQKKHWMNRNRILEPTKGEQYIVIPVDKKSGEKIYEIEIKNIDLALDRIFNQLRCYYNKAPYYTETIKLIENVFNDCSSNSLRDLNIQSIIHSCRRLNIPFVYQVASLMNLDYSKVTHPGQWALEICKQAGANSYLNPPGGKNLFRKEKWNENNIQINFSKVPEFKYNTHHKLPFKPNLSIIDIMMWNNPKDIYNFLQHWDITE